MKTLKLYDGDLVLNASSTRWEVLEDADALTQRLNNRLKLFAGDWFLDDTEGVDWFQVFEKPFSKTYLKSEVYRILMEDEEVSSVEKIDIVPDFITRKIRINIEVASGDEILEIAKEISE